MTNKSKICGMIVCCFALILGSCQAPVTQSASSRSLIKLSLSLTAPAVVPTAARLLLPNTSQIQATATSATGGHDTQMATASFASGATTATMTLALIEGRSYDVTINATDSSGTIIGTASSQIVAANGSTSTFSLLTPLSARYQVSPINPSPAGFSIPAQGAATIQFDLSDCLSVSPVLPTNSPTTGTFYFQNLDGSVFTPSSTTVSGSQTIYVVKPSDLANGATSFCVTAYNATVTADAPGGLYFPFALDPTKVTTYVYVLDNESTQAQIQIVPLNETTGALGSPVAKLLSPTGYSPQKLLVDRLNKRLYVVGTHSSNGYLDGYNTASDGTLTQIAGFPQETTSFLGAGATAVALGLNGYLYWANNTGYNIMTSVFDSNGFLNFTSVSNADNTNTSTVLDMRYDPSVGYLIVTNSTSVTLYSFGSNGLLSPLSSPGGSGPSAATHFAYNPYGNGGYYSVSSTSNALYSWQLGNSPSKEMNLHTTSVTASYTNGGYLVGNPSGYITYLAQVYGAYFYVTPYSISPSDGSLLAAQTVVSVNDGSLVGMALDPTNSNLLVSGTRYLYAFPVATDGSVASVHTSLSLSLGSKLLDLAVIRVK